jgi:hypothetical protein
MEEVVRIQLKENEENCEKLEDEIVSLRKELEKSTTHLNRRLKFEKSTEILDDIIKFQISPLIKTCLGYDKIQMTTKEDFDPHSLINVSTYTPILSLFPLFFFAPKFSLLSHFPLSNVGCGSGYYQIPRSADPQACVSILSHFSSFAIPTLSHFSSDVGVPLRETNILVPQIPMSRVPQSCNTQNDPSICVLQTAPFTFFILSHFFECGCGTPISSTYLFPSCLCPTTHSPMFYKMTLSLS